MVQELHIAQFLMSPPLENNMRSLPVSSVWWGMFLITVLYKTEAGGWQFWDQLGKFRDLARPCIYMGKIKKTVNTAQCEDPELHTQYQINKWEK